MKYQIITSITINADITTVWNTFTQFEAYPNWNSFIKSVKGKVETGETLHVEIDGMKFKPKVLVFEREKELSWLGKLWFSGVFDGRHSFRFKENPEGTTEFMHEEHFRGILVPMMKKNLRTKITDGFKHWNKTLKEKVEAKG